MICLFKVLLRVGAKSENMKLKLRKKKNEKVKVLVGKKNKI